MLPRNTGIRLVETVEINARIPSDFYKVMTLICGTFKVSLDEFITNAVRGELQCCANGMCHDYSNNIIEPIVQQLKEVEGI